MRLSPRVLLLIAVGCGARTPLEGAEPCQATGAERCDGVDNDCDGEVDEGIAPVTCGDLGCTVTVQCVNGVLPECVPRTPTEETCNLIDDDCDGEVDEGFGFGPRAEAILLRSTEFSTGDCSSCSWAWGSAIAPTETGFLAMWKLGFLGGEERANVFGRALDRNGQPLEEPHLLRDDFVLDQTPMQALEPWPQGGLPLDANFRIGTDDVPGVLLMSSEGETSTVIASLESGPYLVPRTVWTGERYISAFTDENRLRVSVLTREATFERFLEIEPLERPVSIAAALYPGRIGFVVSRYRETPETRDQWFFVLDALGNLIVPLRQIDLEYSPWQTLIATDTGWLHVLPNDSDAPSTRQELTLEGEAIGEPLPWPDGRRIDEGGLQSLFVPQPGKGEMFLAFQDPYALGDLKVEFLDGQGDILRGWSGPLPTSSASDLQLFGSPHAAFFDGRIFLIWHGFADGDQANPVWVQEFGCVP
jgi:hypothetical protein